MSVQRFNISDAIDASVGILESGDTYISFGFRHPQGQLTCDSWTHIIGDVEDLIQVVGGIYNRLVEQKS